jgi:hypothetical protein
MTIQLLDTAARLSEFEDDLGRLVDDLYIAVSNILPERYVELGDDVEEDPIGGAVTVEGFVVDDLRERVSEAFDDALDWPLRRALRALREALR